MRSKPLSSQKKRNITRIKTKQCQEIKQEEEEVTFQCETKQMKKTRKQKSCCCCGGGSQQLLTSNQPHGKASQKNSKTSYSSDQFNRINMGDCLRQKASKFVLSDTTFTRSLFLMGGNILDFSDYIQTQRTGLVKSVELHPNNPRIGLIKLKRSTLIKFLELLLSKSEIDDLYVCAAERINRWKDFFECPTSFFPDYRPSQPLLKQEQQEPSNFNNKNFAQGQQQQQQQCDPTLNDYVDAPPTTSQMKQKVIPNYQKIQQQQPIINIKQEEGWCLVDDDDDDEFHSPFSHIINNSRQFYEGLKQPAAAASSSTSYHPILNSNLIQNSNNNNNSFLNKNSCSSISNSNWHNQQQEKQSMIFNQPPPLIKLNQSTKTLIPQDDKKIELQITEILYKNPNWESLVDFFEYIRLSDEFSEAEKTQMRFVAGEKQEIFERIMTLIYLG